MAAVVFALVALVVLALLGAVHRYVWRRFVGDTTAPGSTLRRVGTVAAFVLPLLSLGAMTSGRVGAPFWLQQLLAWPGFLWLACLLYLTLALLVGEVVRPLLLRFLARRDARTETAENGTADGAASGTASGAPSGTTSGTPAAPASGALAGTPGEPRTRTGELVASRTAAAPSSSDPAVRTVPDPAAVAEAEPAAKADAEPATETDPESMAKADTEPAAKAGTESAESPSDEAPSAQAPAAPALAPGPSRRLFVSRVVGGAAAAAGLATVGYGTYGVLRGPSVQRITVPLAKLPRAAHGFRIAVVSDIHIGPILGRAHTRRIVDTINATSPDLVAVVGDLVDGSVADLGSAAEPLAALRARHGSYFVTGNHEYFSGAEQWVDHVRELGLIPLENARVEIDGFDLDRPSTTSRAKPRGRGRTSSARWATGTGGGPPSSWRTSPSSSTTPSSTASTSSSPATPTAGSSGRATCSPSWPTPPSPDSNATATPSCSSRAARAPGGRRSGWGPRPTSPSWSWRPVRRREGPADRDRDRGVRSAGHALVPQLLRAVAPLRVRRLRSPGPVIMKSTPQGHRQLHKPAGRRHETAFSDRVSGSCPTKGCECPIYSSRCENRVIG